MATVKQTHFSLFSNLAHQHKIKGVAKVVDKSSSKIPPKSTPFGLVYTL